MCTNYITVFPAYGVVLNTLAEVKEHWEKERDFSIVGYLDGGRYIAKHEAEKYNLKLEVRYGKDLKKVTILG